MPGPLPNPQRARRNAPTIPSTDLPAGGRRGAVPKPPKWVELGPKGLAWWRWAWRTPQAAAWSSGHEAFVANRARLEDELDVEADSKQRLALLKECREGDDRLGLTPKSLAALRWRIVADEAPAEGAALPAASAQSGERRQRLKVV